MFFKLNLLFISAFCLTLGFCAAGEITDSKTGVSFPSTVAFDFNGNKYDLEATGVATRKKFFVKVYSIAHYLQDAPSNGVTLQQVMDPSKAKQFSQIFVRNVALKKVTNAYRASLKRSFSGDAAILNEFIGFFKHNFKKGDEQVLRWIPGGTIEVFSNGEKIGSVQNEEFAVAVWNIWFQGNSVVKRDELISYRR